MIPLWLFVREHRGAVNYDLMTKTQYLLRTVGTGFFSWDDVADFLAHLPADSAVRREMDPETAQWLDGRKTAAVVADVFDMLAALKWEFEVVHLKKDAPTPDKPKPYPRPHMECDEGGERVGSDPIPISEFDAWWESKTKQGGEKQ